MAKDTFKEIENFYKDCDKFTKQNNQNLSGGFISKKTEKSFSRCISSWKKTYIENKNNNLNIKRINDITFNTKGNPFNDKDFSKIITFTYDKYKSIIKECKNDKRISENSILKVYCDVYDALKNQKLQKMYNLAYDEFDKKNRVTNNSVENIMIMCHQLMVSFIYYSLAFSPNLIDTYQSDNKNNYYIVVNEEQTEFYKFIKVIGFTALQTSFLFNSFKNPAEDLKKAIKTQKESSEKIAKAKESYDIATTKSLYYELSTESYLVDDSNNLDRGEESAIMVAVIILGVISGLLALIPLIRHAIYMSGTLKVDMEESLKIDVMTIMVNIESLKEKRDATTDPKERKKIQSIIDKQQKFVDKHKDLVEQMVADTTAASYESDYVIENEDKEDEKEIANDTSSTENGGNSSDSGDSFQILI